MSENMVREPSRVTADGAQMNEAPLRLLDLFSGIGGFSLGLERTGGFKTVAFCEIAPACRHLLNHHWPDVPCYDDVSTLTGERLAADGVAVDALCGGFPCQDLSYAGKGAGLAGERSGLWFQVARLLRELRDLGRPVRIIVLENVAALLGRGLGVVLGDLAALGYDAEWDCIPASAVGAPHRRDRIWIVAYARSLEHQGFGDAFRRALAAGLPEAFMANTACERGNGSWRRPETSGRSEPANGSDVGDADRARLSLAGLAGAVGQGDGGVKPWPAADGAGWWSAEPDVGRVAHGISAELDGADVAVQEHDQEASAESLGSRGGLPGVRGYGAAGAASSGLLGAGSRRGPVPALSCESGSSGRNPQGETAEELHDLRGRVYAEPQQEAHDLQPRMSGGSRAPERGKALGWWGQEPNIPRVAHGVPARVDRLHGLGNAVVPKIPELIGRAILQARAA